MLKKTTIVKNWRQTRRSGDNHKSTNVEISSNDLMIVDIFRRLSGREDVDEHYKLV